MAAINSTRAPGRAIWLVLATLALACAGCGGSAGIDVGAGSTEHAEDGRSDDGLPESQDLVLPALEPVNLGGGRIRIVATTSIIGDVVGKVAGDRIKLTVLIEPGQDPHSYTPGTRDLVDVAEAHAIFINGWDLEEGLADDLAAITQSAPLVPISAGIHPLEVEAAERGHDEEEGEEDDHAHGQVDPHVWFSIDNVRQWVENAVETLSALDPAGASAFRSQADAYLIELEALERYAADELARVPSEKRYLVTNHDSLRYFARDYGFEIIGTVLPAASTVAEPSAADLAELVESLESQGTCALFTETTASDQIAGAVAAELDHCSEVRLVPLYTGSLGPPGSGADSYTGMFRYNVDRIVEALSR